MNLEIKFSYIIEHIETKKKDNVIFDYVEIFNGTAITLFRNGLYKDYSIIAKRLFIGIFDGDNEIYDGDIVEFRSHPKKLITAGEIFWEPRGCRFMIRYFADDIDKARKHYSLQNIQDLNHIERIGNIYQNPELISPFF